MICSGTSVLGQATVYMEVSSVALLYYLNYYRFIMSCCLVELVLLPFIPLLEYFA